jgi:hypothetical protein
MFKRQTVPPPRDQLRQAIEQIRIARRVTMLDMDADAGLQDGYFAKCICGTRRLSDGTLDKVLKALGVKILLVPDDGTEGMLASGTHLTADLSTSKMRKIAALGGKARWAGVPPEDRKAHAQLIAEVRWNGETRRRKTNASRKAAATRHTMDGLRRFGRHVEAFIRANPPPSRL